MMEFQNLCSLVSSVSCCQATRDYLLVVTRKDWSNVIEEVEVTPSLFNAVEDFKIHHMNWLVSLAMPAILTASSTGGFQLVAF